MAEQKIAKKGLSTLWGVFEVEKTIFLMKIFNFSPQRIFRFSKMAEQKTPRKGLSTLPGGFRGWKKRII